MTKKPSLNNVEKIAAQFAPKFIDFSRILKTITGVENMNATASNWRYNNFIPGPGNHLVIMSAADEAELEPEAKARIKALLEKMKK